MQPGKTKIMNKITKALLIACVVTLSACVKPAVIDAQAMVAFITHCQTLGMQAHIDTGLGGTKMECLPLQKKE